MKRLLSVIAAFCLLAGAIGLSGCNGKVSPGGSSSQPGSSSSVSSEPEEAELLLWATPMIKGFDGSGENYEDWSQTQADRFTDENPNITFKVEIIPWEQLQEKTNVAISANATPDVMEDSCVRAMGYAARGKTVALDDVLADVLSDMDPGVLKGCQLKGKTYVGLVATSPDCMAVNTTIFKEAGALDLLPKDKDRTWTYDEFITALQAVNNPSKQLYGTAFYAGSASGIEDMLAFIWGSGTVTYNTDGTEFIMNDENAVKGLDFMKKLIDLNLVAPGAATYTANNMYDLFFKRQIAVIPAGGYYNITQVKAMKESGEITGDFDIMLVTFPHAQGKNPVIPIYTEGWFAFDTGDAATIKWSKEFIKFALNQKDALENYSKASGQFAARTSIPLYGDNADMQYFGSLVTKFGYGKGDNCLKFSEIRSMIFPALQAVFTGTKTSKQTLDDLAASANAALTAG